MKGKQEEEEEAEEEQEQATKNKQQTNNNNQQETTTSNQPTHLTVGWLVPAALGDIQIFHLSRNKKLKTQQDFLADHLILAVNATKELA